MIYQRRWLSGKWGKSRDKQSAKAAGVSKAYLYTQPLFRDRIDALRQQEREQTVRERVARPTGKTDAGKDLVILAKERRIKELEEENRKRKQQLKTALGKTYDRLWEWKSLPPYLPEKNSAWWKTVAADNKGQLHHKDFRKQRGLVSQIKPKELDYIKLSSSLLARRRRWRR
jgi:hypothetical protein